MPTQIWKPDTCECVIEEVHDPKTPGSGVQFSRALSKCPVHISVPDNALYGVLFTNPDGENKRKNLVHKFLLEQSAIGTSTVIDGKTVFVLKTGVTVAFEYNAQRVLVVTVTGVTLTTQQRNSIASFCTSTFGAGKVILA